MLYFCLFYVNMDYIHLFDPILKKEVENMKTCNNCGAEIQSNASFYNDCGVEVQTDYVTYRRTDNKEPISVGGWIGRSLIPFIPAVGGIVYLILLFIWSGDAKKEDTFRNWAKAQLLFMLVAVILIIVIVAVVIGVVAASESL